ncbi:FAD-dependent oxidoreductase [Variovorax sp. WS11]|uniref:FAD-dependent oxidoreductase n=1 Tax=Variovorax sp. WS11 TaxID=1105204 RepID=UPI0013D9C145|nr:FAD-dependent oxidoreductase [Variovorax sp. WS11]NDZ14312.1 FAD-dependent oxidoreductase [Variovorax sp. WS11]
MRVLVLGAGLLGVTSAYYLQQLGHEVTVIDRHAMPAAKARGLASSGLTIDAARLLQQSAARRSAQAGWKELRRQLRRRMGKWLDCTVGRFNPLEHLVRLGAYSRASARALRDDVGVPAGARTAGLLSLYTDAGAFEARMAQQLHWRALGCEEQLLSAQETLQLEPALQAARETLAGAGYALDDPARDPAQFAASLVFLCRAAGVRFLTRHQVLSLEERNGRIEHVDALDPAGRPVRLQAQGYVLALGVSSVVHAEKLGIAMPLRFLREYILTLPIQDLGRAPRVALCDRQDKLRIHRVETPAGDCLRVSATVHAGFGTEGEPDSDRFEAMLQRVETLLPGAVDTSRARFETAMHAVSRNGLPMIGKTRVRNLFLNTAPGARGWINACGAGKSIARIVSGLRPELEFAFRGL